MATTPQPTSKLPRKRSAKLASEVYGRIRADIYDFRLLPGDRFSEGEIADRLQVSRTPVREALFRLQRDGYVDVLYRSGWQVRPFDMRQFENLYDVRLVLENAAIERLVRLSLNNRLEDLASIWCVPASRYYDDPEVLAVLDEQFHVRLVAASGNPEMAAIHQNISDRMRIVRRLDFKTAPRIAKTYEEHAAIIDRLRDGETKAAQDILTRHIQDSQAEVKTITVYMLHAARERFGR
jgi:DNA-binding GntR family transcriptional regulator